MKSNSGYYPCDAEKAGHVLWAVYQMGWSQTKAAIELELNVGTVNHVIHGRRFPNAIPKAPPEWV